MCIRDRVLSLEDIYHIIMKQMDVHRGLVPLPMPLAKALGFVLGFLPVPPMTLDQMILLETDNVLSGDLPGLKDLGIKPSTLDANLPQYMRMHRKFGQYNPLKPTNS